MSKPSASSILFNVMASVDDIKEKIDDGEYLNLCNLLKELHKQIKDIKPQAEAAPEIVNSRSITLILGEYLSTPEFFDYDGNLIEHWENLIMGYNQLLQTIEEERNESGIHEWFVCACGCSLNTNAITEHIADESHALNFVIN